MTPEEGRLLAVLWEIEMEAKRATVDDPVWALPNRIIVLAQSAMGSNRSLAQQLAAARRSA